jgi:predicted phage terminase large subunit-like protein
LICFDELTHFSQSQFTYLLSRNRSLCGVRPYVRATTNPDADSWVKSFIAPWVDDEHPDYPWPAGELRYFTQQDGKFLWVDEDWRDENGLRGKSLTFIPASVYDNQILLAANPEYLANLRALDYVDQRRLLGGDWKVRPEAGKVFNRGWFEIVEAAPAGGEAVRFWDMAATEKKQEGDDPDWTAGVRMRRVGNVYFVEDLLHERNAPAAIDRLIKNSAAQDGKAVGVAWEEEGGASGKKVSHDLATMLAGYSCQAVRPDGDKLQRAKPAAAQALAGNIKLVRGAWNNALLSELHGFPDLPHDDIVDALAGAFNVLAPLTHSAMRQAQVKGRGGKPMIRSSRARA